MEKRRLTIFGIIALILIFTLGVCIIIFDAQNIGTLLEPLLGVVQVLLNESATFPELNLVNIVLAVLYSSMFFWLIFAYIGAWIGVGYRKQGGYLVALIFGFLVLILASSMLVVLMRAPDLKALFDDIVANFNLDITFFIETATINSVVWIILPLTGATWLFTLIAYIRQISLNKIINSQKLMNYKSH